MEVKLNKEYILNFLKDKKNYLVQNFHIEEIGLFGSFIHENQKEKSDIDILVAFSKEGKTFKNYMGLKFFLEDNLQRKIDLVTKTGLKEIIKEQIELETIYA